MPWLILILILIVVGVVLGVLCSMLMSFFLSFILSKFPPKDGIGEIITCIVFFCLTAALIVAIPYFSDYGDNYLSMALYANLILASATLFFNHKGNSSDLLLGIFGDSSLSQNNWQFNTGLFCLSWLSVEELLSVFGSSYSISEALGSFYSQKLDYWYYYKHVSYLDAILITVSISLFVFLLIRTIQQSQFRRLLVSASITASLITIIYVMVYAIRLNLVPNDGHQEISNNSNIIFAGIILACILLIVIMVTSIIIYKRGAATRRLNKIENLLNGMSDSLEKDILIWMQFKIKTEVEIKSLAKEVKKIKKELKRNNTPELEAEMLKKESEIQQKRNEVDIRKLSGEKDLDCQTISSFDRLVTGKYQTLKNCREIWKDGFGSVSLETKASEWLDSTSEIPILRSGRCEYQFFPAFVLCIKDGYELKIIEYSSLKIDKNKKEICSDPFNPPVDATFTWERWDYERVNGGPDRRYKNNSVHHYYYAGVIVLDSFRILFSNEKSSDNFVDGVLQYRRCLKTKKPVNNGTANRSRATESGKRNEMILQDETSQKQLKSVSTSPRQNLSRNDNFIKSFASLSTEIKISDYLDSITLLNMLEDYHAFEEDKAYKFILRSMIDMHVLNAVRGMTEWTIESDKLLSNFVQATGLNKDKAKDILLTVIEKLNNE